MMARIPDPDRSHLPAEGRQALATLPDLALFRMLANAPTVIGPWLALGGTLLASLELPARRRELAILTVAHAGRCRYEWVQHEAIAAASGVAAEAVPDVEVSAEAIAAARAELGDRQTVELLCLVGYYVATAIVARSAGIDIDQPARLAVVDASERFAGR